MAEKNVFQHCRPYGKWFDTILTNVYSINDGIASDGFGFIGFLVCRYVMFYDKYLICTRFVCNRQTYALLLCAVGCRLYQRFMPL